MRQFLAVAISKPMQDRLAGLQRELKKVEGWRWIRPSSIHLTIRFLGDVDAERDERARPAWREAAGCVRPFRFELSGFGVFPPRGRPRVLWVGLEDRAGGARFADLAGSVERAARHVGFEANSRPLRPHLTLARAARSGSPEIPDSWPEVVPEVAPAEELVLFRSELLPTGARYTPLEIFPLAR